MPRTVHEEASFEFAGAFDDARVNEDCIDQRVNLIFVRVSSQTARTMFSGKNLLLIFAALFVLAIGGAATWLSSFWLDYPEADRLLESEVKRAKEAGFPNTADKVAPRLEANAWPKVQDAIDALIQAEIESGTINDTRRAVLTGALPTVRDRLERAQGVFQALDQIGPGERALPAHDFARGPWSEFEEYQYIGRLLGLQSIRTIYRAKTGDAASAMQDLERLRNLVDCLTVEPLADVGFIRSGGISQLITTSQSLANEWSGRPEQLSALGRWFETVNIDLDAKALMSHQVYLAWHCSRNWDTLGGIQSLRLLQQRRKDDLIEPTYDSLIDSGLPDGVVQRAQLSRALNYWNDAAKKIDDGATPVDLADWARSKSSELRRKRGFSYLLIKLHENQMRTLTASLASQSGRLAATKAMIRFLEHRARTGNTPQSLEEAGIEELDPFTGLPLKLATVNGRLRIYSLGANRKDEGGRSRRELSDETRDRLAGDIVVTLPIPSN